MRYPDRQDRRGRPALAPAAAAPPRPLRRVLVVFAAILGFAALLVYPAASSAADPNLVFCTSTIDPKCQPGNLPILIEAGIISGKGVTVAAPATSAGGVVAGLAPGPGLATVGILSVGTTAAGSNSPVAQLKQRGLEGIRIGTDGLYVQPAQGQCGGSPSTSNPPLYSEVEVYPRAACNMAPLASTSGILHQLVKFNVTTFTEGSPARTALRVNFESPLANGGGVRRVLRFDLYCSYSPTGAKPPSSDSAIVIDYDNAPPQGPFEIGCSPSYVGYGGGLRTPEFLVVTSRMGGAYGSGERTFGIAWSKFELSQPGGGQARVEGLLTSSVRCAPQGGGAPYDVVRTVNASVASGGDLQPPDALCNPGDTAISTEGVTFAPTTAPPGTQPIQVVKPATVPTPLVDIPSDYPQCFSGAIVACKIELYRIGQGGQLESCGSIGQLCEGWAQHPTPAELYKCKYGPYDVDIRSCGAYRAPSIGVLPNADDEGNWFPINHPVPQPLPNDTGTGTAPTTVPFPTDGFRDAEGNPTNCWPTGWGVFNPYAWVYQPLMCAALALFVPRQSVIQSIATQTRDAYSGSIIGHGLEMGDTIRDTLPQGVSIDCAGPPVIFGGPLNDLGISGTYFPLDSCSEPMSTFRTIAFWALPAFTAFGLLFAISRYVAAIIGFVGAGATNETAEWERKVRFS